ncbi:hypothetical protein [Stenotrophomonas riyadhensis]
MIPDYYLYHGAVLASLLSGTGVPLRIESPKMQGRPTEYVINNIIGLHIKHATQRIRPWHFGFTPENIESITSLNEKYQNSFLVLVCKQDGIVTIDLETVIGNISPSTGLWIRADREKRKHYRLHGPLGEFPRKYDSSLLSVKELLKINARQ